MAYILKNGTLYHYGINGQKKGIRRYQNYDGTYTEEGKARRRKDYIKSGKEKINKLSTKVLKLKEDKSTINNKEDWTGHDSTPRDYKPNTILDHKREDGTIKTRTEYDENGRKKKDIHTDDHGHPNAHPNGAHVHDYEWDENGDLKNRVTREPTDEEKERNNDLWNQKK